MAHYAEQLRQVVQNIDDRDRIVFFVGAGISVSAGHPLWGTATRLALETATGLGLSAAATAYCQEKLDKAAYYELFEILRSELTQPAYYNLAAKVFGGTNVASRSEEHTSELQSLRHLVCRLLLE